ncbi:hypothetical protein J6590_003511 [Homalodisca vitripennis]|nr:hypothetical protein J6590_003511 [Homalodisca vitripennis]
MRKVHFQTRSVAGKCERVTASSLRADTGTSMPLHSTKNRPAAGVWQYWTSGTHITSAGAPEVTS